MSQWFQVAELEDIPVGQTKAVQAGDESVVICNVDGQYYALLDQCSHQELPLSEGGRLHGKEITCPWHGARFDVTTGTALQMPAVSPVVTFPVKVEGNAIFVEVE